jgi:signal transduction histidine kinase
MNKATNTNIPYSPQGLAERVLAASRLVLATFSLLAVWLDPSEPAKYVGITYGLMSCYVGYSLVLAVIAWRSDVILVRLRFWAHCFDLVLFSLLIYFTEGPPTSPFFVFFLFSLVCGAIRWQWKGTLWTAAVAIPLFVGLGIYAAEILHDPHFDLSPFINRSVYLVVVTALLGYLGVYQQWLSTELSKLAAWPSTASQDARPLVRDMLAHVGDIFGAPRALLVWEEPEEPWLNWVEWSRNAIHWKQEPPQKFATLVADPLVETGFLCLNVQTRDPTVLQLTATGLSRWKGQPLSEGLQIHTAIKTVLSFPLHGESFLGRVFFLDKPHMTSDDLVLGTIAVREIGNRLDQFYLLERLQKAAAIEERIRLARDLHDGLLQSLTVATIQLETVQRSLEQRPAKAREHLAAIQRNLVEEQRELRFFIQELKPPAAYPDEREVPLAEVLAEIITRVEWQWGLRIDLQLSDSPLTLPFSFVKEIRFLLLEALVNAARHGRARSVRVAIDIDAAQVRIQVADDGRGFSFRGRHDLKTLIMKQMGPATLRDRVASLHGDLVIASTDAGSQLLITLPLVTVEENDVYSSRAR